MSASKTNSEKISIEDWVKAFDKVYNRADRPRRPEEFWNSVMAHLSGVGEAIRRTNYQEIVEESAYAFCWMCGFVLKCNSDAIKEDDSLFSFENCLSEIVALKFPDRCGHCEKCHCSCDPIKKDAQKDKSAKYRELLKEWKAYQSLWRQRGLNEWLNRFWGIFGGRIHIQTLETIGFHMLEEAGEEAKAVRELVLFRKLAKTHEHGVDEGFLNKLSSIESLVSAYQAFTDKAEAAPELNGKKFKDAKREILTSDNDDIIKARIVHAKMDLVVEIADTFSWLCAVLLKLRTILRELDRQNNTESEQESLLIRLDIEKTLHDKFGMKGEGGIVRDEEGIPRLKCYVCKEDKCKCKFFHENAEEEPPEAAPPEG